MESKLPKLYKGVVTSGNTMIFEEIPEFKQTDLRQNAIFVLDMGDDLFVWIGEDVTDEERKAAFDIYNHVQPLKKGYPHKWSVVMTKQRLEPESFKKSFGRWEPELLIKLRDSDDEDEKFDALNFNEVED